ncbi:HAD family hydrolase [Kribbella sp. NPDC002412]
MKALLVDLFSTLVPSGDAERDVVNVAMSEVLGVDAEAFTREFAATSYERFTGAYGDLPSTLRVIARRTGADPSDQQVLDATALRRDLSRRLLNAAPAGTLSALETLRSAGWRLGLVSNITSETQLQWSHSPLPPYFEATAFSAEVGAAKPEPKIYLAACDALNVEPGDCVYIGDGNDKELPGAAALGMHAIRTTEHSDSDPSWTGPSINSFAQLPDLIGTPT